MKRSQKPGFLKEASGIQIPQSDHAVLISHLVPRRRATIAVSYDRIMIIIHQVLGVD